jgi:Acyl carrier protein
MSNNDPILANVIQVVENILKPQIPIAGKDTLLSSLNADSIDKVTIMLTLEELYVGIDIEDDAIEKFLTVGDIADYITHKIG